MKYSSVWIFSFTVFLGFFWPFLGQEGMFLDGVTYGAIARNMASGMGAFSTPHYTDTLFPVFYEQPPLGLWLESLAFRLFGDHYWVDRLFPFVLALANGAMIVSIWRYVCRKTQDERRARFAWMPLLFWVASPIVFWCFQQNMLECSMSLFILLAIFFALRGSLEEKPVFYLLSSLFIAAGALSKGPIAFFPAAVPFVFAISRGGREWFKGAAFSGVILLSALGLLALFVQLVPGMDAYLDYYLHRQLFPTLAGAREKQVEFPFAFLPHLLEQLALPLLIATGAVWGKKARLDQMALFFILLGLCGVLPLAFTPKQSAHYLAPSIPVFALGLAWIISGAFSNAAIWVKMEQPRIRIVFMTLLALVLLSPLWFWGKYSRDSQLLTDIKKLRQRVPAESTIGIPEEWRQNWLLHAYFVRMGNISLEANGSRPFAITPKNATFRPGFEKIDLGLNTLELYQRAQDTLPDH